MAQLVLGAVGAVIGGYFGGPAGAQAGWAVGSAIGGAVENNKKKLQGPRLQDLKVGSSEYGTPIPRTFGSPRVPGQIWWASEKREVATTTSQGKGGGPKVTNYTYEVDLLIGLADNEIAGITRIWSNGKLVYTKLTAADDASIAASESQPIWARLALYDGASTQMPDAVYEASVTDAPGYRGRSFVFIEGLQLGNSGQLPNLTFEIPRNADVVQAATTRVLYQFAGANPVNDISTFNDDLTNAGSAVTFNGAGATFVYSDISFLRTQETTSIVSANSRWTIQIWVTISSLQQPARFPTILEIWQASPNLSFQIRFDHEDHRGKFYFFDGDNVKVSSVYDRGQKYHLCLMRTDSGVAMWVNGARVTAYGGPANLVNAFLILGNQKVGSIGQLNSAFVGQISSVKITSNAALFDESFTPPDDPLQLDTFTYTITNNSLEDVVGNLCASSGLAITNYATAELAATEVKALAITQVSPVRATIEQLAAAFFFECTLRDKLYFRPRAEEPVDTLLFADLAAAQDAPAAEPLALTVASDLELPPQVAVTYANLLDDHQAGTEYSDRLISGQAATQTVQLALGLTPSEAKGIADAIIQDAAASLTSTNISLPMEYAHLEAGDVVNVIDDDAAQYRLRLVRKRDEAGVLAFEAVFDDQSALTSLQVTDETQVPSGTVTAPGDTLFKPLDIPILRDADDAPGFYVAAKGSTVNWPGAQIQASVDDVSFTTVAEVNESAVYGTCSTTLATYTGVGFDERNSVTVNVGNGELSSSTRDAMLADATINAMLIGSEVIRFRTATLSSPGVYVLTGLLRGQRGTEWAIATHAASERAVLLRPQGLRRVATQSSLIGVARYLRGVTLGTIADAASQAFTDTGVGLECYAPVDLRASRADNNDAVLTWKRRTRVATRFTGPSGILVPLGEASESYDLELWTAGYGALLRTFSGLGAATATYTAAQQVADGGTVASVAHVRVYQRSAVVGRGKVLQASVTLPSAGGAGSSLSPQIFAASADGWLASSERFESSGAPGVVNDLRVTTFWKSADPEGPYTAITTVTTTTTSAETANIVPVLGRVAQTDDYVLSIALTAGAKFTVMPSDLSAAPALVTPSIAFAAPRIVAAEASRFLLFGDGSQVYESTDGQAWTLLGSMAGDTFPHVIGSGDYLTHAITKIGSRWFLSFGVGGGIGASANRLYYTNHADARTGWTACTGITVGTNAALHEEVIFDGTKHYAAVTNFAAGTADIYASTDGGASFTLETTATGGTGFETSTSGTTSPFMAAFQVTGTTGADYVRAYMLNGVVFEKLVGTTSWSAKAHGLVNPGYFVSVGPNMAALDNASVFGGGGSQVRYETNGVFALASGFGA